MFIRHYKIREEYGEILKNNSKQGLSAMKEGNESIEQIRLNFINDVLELTLNHIGDIEEKLDQVLLKR